MKSAHVRVALVAALALLLPVGSAAAIEQSSDNIYSSNQATLSSNKAKGWSKVTLDSVTKTVDGSVPPTTTFQKFTLPEGAKVNTKIGEACDFSKFESNPSECGSENELGSGVIDVDARSCNIGLIQTNATIYRAETRPGNVETLGLLVTEESIGVRILLEIPVTNEGGRHVITIADVPAPLGCPLPIEHGLFNIDATKKVKIKVKKGRKKVTKKVKQAWLKLPNKCSGSWSFGYEQVLTGGKSISYDIPVPCKS